MLQRRQQLPFNLATREGVLYDTCMDAFPVPGPPGSGTPGITEPTAEEALDPASLLGSLHQQDLSVYSHPQKPSPQLPVFPQIEDVDLEQPQSSFEQAFLDSHALLSVPGQNQAPQKTTATGDLTAEAMIESLEQILGDIGDGGVEGLEVEETELRDWENTLVRMNNERADASKELNRILANDVFSYVEEALRRETGGFVQGSDQTGAQQHHGSVISKDEQPTTDPRSGIRDQTEVGCSTGLKHASEVVSHGVTPAQTHTEHRSPHQGHTSRLWPSSGSSHHCGNQMISSQPCHADYSQPEATQQSWLVPNTNTDHSSRTSGSAVTDQKTQNVLNHTQVVPQLQSPSVWQPLPPPPPSFPHHILTHCSHTPGGLNSRAPSHHPQIQLLSGSCMYERVGGHIPNAATVPARLNGPLLGPTRIGQATPGALFPLSHQDRAARVLNQSTGSPMKAACMDVGNIGFVRLNGGSADLGTARSDYLPENGSLQSPFYCWNGEAQVK